MRTRPRTPSIGALLHASQPLASVLAVAIRQCLTRLRHAVTQLTWFLLPCTVRSGRECERHGEQWSSHGVCAHAGCVSRTPWAPASADGRQPSCHAPGCGVCVSRGRLVVEAESLGAGNPRHGLCDVTAAASCR